MKTTAVLFIAPFLIATSIPAADSPKTIPKLGLLAAGIDDQGRFSLTITNECPKAINIVNITWKFYLADGQTITSKMPWATATALPKMVVTTHSGDGLQSTIIDSGQRRTFINRLVTAEETVGRSANRSVFAEVLIFMRRRDIESLKLEVDYEGPEDTETIRQIIPPIRFPLKKTTEFRPSDVLGSKLQSPSKSAPTVARQSEEAEILAQSEEWYRQNRRKPATATEAEWARKLDGTLARFSTKDAAIYRYMRTR